MTDTAPAITLIVEDDPLVRDLLVDILSEDGFPIHAFANAAEALNSPWLASALCVVSDIRMPGMSGIELQRRLAQDLPWLPVLLITGHADIAMAVSAMKDGAFDFIQKPFAPNTLLERVRAARAHGLAMRNVASAARTLNEQFAKLTAREAELLRAIAEGMVTKEIARQFDISARTVEHHRERIIAKLGVNGISALIHLYARWQHLNSPEAAGRPGNGGTAPTH